MTQAVLHAAGERVKVAVTEAATAVVADLHHRFPPADLINALSTVQPRYWFENKGRSREDMQIEVERHLGVLAKQFGHLGHTPSVGIVPPLLDHQRLQEQRDEFVDVMQGRVGIFNLSSDLPSAPSFWRQVCRSNNSGGTSVGGMEALPVLAMRVSEFIKVAKVFFAFPIGSIENERRFSRMNLIHDAVRNRLLADHLNDCVRIASSNHTPTTFNVAAVHRRWYRRVDRGRYMANQ